MKPQLLRIALAIVLGIGITGAQTAHVYHHVPPIGQITNTVLCNFSCSNPPDPAVAQEAVALKRWQWHKQAHSYRSNKFQTLRTEHPFASVRCAV